MRDRCATNRCWADVKGTCAWLLPCVQLATVVYFVVACTAPSSFDCGKMEVKRRIQHIYREHTCTGRHSHSAMLCH